MCLVLRYTSTQRDYVSFLTWVKVLNSEGVVIVQSINIKVDATPNFNRSISHSVACSELIRLLKFESVSTISHTVDKEKTNTNKQPNPSAKKSKLRILIFTILIR